MCRGSCAPAIAGAEVAMWEARSSQRIVPLGSTARHTARVYIIAYGAAPMPVEKLRKAIKFFGKVFIQSYDQGEAPSTISTLGKEDHIAEGTPEEVARLSSGRQAVYDGRCAGGR